MSEYVSESLSDKIPEDTSDRMPISISISICLSIYLCLYLYLYLYLYIYLSSICQIECQNQNTGRIECTFSRLRSKGSRFTLGVWGLRVFSLDVAFTLIATVRNRSQPSARGHHGRAYGECCKRCHFWRFQTSQSLVSPGRRGTLWHSNMFQNVSKVVLCGRRNLLRRFQKMRCIFRGRRNAWSFCVAGAAL